VQAGETMCAKAVKSMCCRNTEKTSVEQQQDRKRVKGRCQCQVI
jgi:hypothetical protein